MVVRQQLTAVLNYIMTVYDRAISAFKENLLTKSSKSEGYPLILWIQPPMHEHFPNNSHRFRFNKSLEEVVKLHAATFTLPLKKVWDHKDISLFLSSQRFTPEGYKTYWEAVDRTVRYFDSVILKKLDKKKPKNLVGQNDQFKWRRCSSTHTQGEVMIQDYHKLLPPPSRYLHY